MPKGCGENGCELGLWRLPEGEFNAQTSEVSENLRGLGRINDTLYGRNSEMARVKLNPIIEELRGQVGELVFKRYGDRVVVSKKPDMSKVKPSAAQLAHRERFRQATVYGRVALADPATRALYEAAAKSRGKPVVSVAIGDFFNAPSVDGIDLSGYTGAVGDEIVIAASDDFAVWRVRVGLSDVDGAVIEEGEAVESPGDSGRWVYVATAAVAAGTKVWAGVAALDRPGGMDEGMASKVV